jgi:hypothetical protein
MAVPPVSKPRRLATTPASQDPFQEARWNPAGALLQAKLAFFALVTLSIRLFVYSINLAPPHPSEDKDLDAEI